MQNNLPSEITSAPPPSLAQAQVMYYPDYVEQSSDLRDYWHILMKRKWWLLSVFLLVVSLGAAWTFTMTPIYEGTTTLQIIQDNPSALLGGSALDPLAAMSGTSQLDRFYQTQYDILQTPEIAYGLIDSLNLTEHPSYKNLQAQSKDATPELIRRQYAARIGLEVVVFSKHLIY